jgi:DNA ligase (NAD+)
MNKNEIKNQTSLSVSRRIQKLRDEISRLRSEYHIKNNPKVTDDVYESLSRELRNLEKDYPEFIDKESSVDRVAGKPLPSFKKVKHEIRMTSLNDVFSIEEISDWENRVLKILGNSQKYEYFCELKLDGLSASLFYENGIFVRGATRGDGFIGEDVTENLKMIESIPLKLKPSSFMNAQIPDYVEIRGEVVMFKKVWENLNKKQIEQGKPTFANTRNAAAGSLRQLDPTVVKERKLDFFAWDVAQLRINNEELGTKSHSDKHKILRDFGFQVSLFEKRVKNIKEISDFIKKTGEERESLPYGTDGMVISVDNLSLYETLGIVGKAPRYMVAYKYQAERATTTVIDITVNVGRTGAITPLAHFNPTLVAGSTVSKATLHNIDQIERLDIRVGDTVVIQKAGDVIPEVVEVLKNMRIGKEKKFKMPENCPVCNSKIERKGSFKGSPMSNGLAELLSSKKTDRRGDPRTLRKGASIETTNIIKNSSVAYYCINKNCPARNRRGMQHFVNIFEIYEIGPKILDRLKDEGLISDSADLFTLEKLDLSGLERFGEKSADNIISSIQSHKKVLLWRFIYALGIIHVGEQTSRDLADYFGSLDKIIKADIDTINNIENIGPAVSESIVEFFHDEFNLNFINKLLENGVNIHHEKVTKGSLFGKIFVLTGTLPTLSRDEAKKKIIENGGKVSSSVSIKTDYLLAGDEAGSKYKDAEKKGVKIISEQEFLKMI